MEKVKYVACAAVGGLVGVALYENYRKQEGQGHAHQGINRDDSGPRFERDLPVGKRPIQLYSLGTPNGQKVSIMLIELGLPFDSHFINIGKEDQFGSGFTRINPNSKIPAMVDHDGPGGKPIRVFESSSILLYLAEKTGRFLPKDPAARQEAINWLFFVHGAAPYFGQFGHFFKYYAGKRKLSYPIERYKMEAKRLCDVLDKQLAKNEYICGDEYTIVDMSAFTWVRCLAVGYNAEKELGLKEYKNLQAWISRVSARPAVKLGLRVNGFSEPEEFKNFSTDGNM